MTCWQQCLRFTALNLFITALVALSCSQAVSAKPGGISGVSQGGCGGFGCHGTQSSATNVTLTGLREGIPGQTFNYVVRVAHQTNTYFGLNASMVGGAGAPAGMLNAGVGTQVMNGEITHTGPKAGDGGGGTDFSFTWIAPQEPGQYTFYASGNAVNNNTLADGGDFYNTTGAIQITIKGASITAPNGGAYCRGSALSITWTQSGFTNFRIEASNNNFANTEVLANSVAATANSYSWTIPAGQEPGNAYVVRLVNTADGQEVKRSNTFAIKGSPTITTHPQTQTVCEGRTLALAVGSDFTGATYQWKKNGNIIPGATTSAYQVSVAKADDAGNYEGIAFGCGGNTTSNTAVITIGVKPKITLQPVDRFACENDTVSLVADGEGANATYQWYKNGSVLPGKTSKTLKFSSVLVTDEGSYALHISGSCLPDAVSNEAKIEVIERPAITIQPTDKNLKVGDTLSLNVDGYGEQITYVWKKDGVVITGATQKLYRKTGIARADSGLYEAVITNPCGTVTSRKSLVRIVPSDGPGIPELASVSLELGALPLCANVDTTIAGLLKNAGGSPLVVSSVSANPPSLLLVQDFTTPQTIAAGGNVNLRLIVTPTAMGAINGTVTFFTANGNAVFEVHGNAGSGILADKDTLMFLQGETGFSRCATLSLDARCSTATVSQATVTGVGAGSYTVTTPVPGNLAPATPLQFCVQTTSGTGGDAVLVLETTAGQRSIQLRRGVFSSVDDVAESAIHIQPNPSSDAVSIMGLPSGADVRIVSLHGVEIANLSNIATTPGDSEVVWDGRHSNGSRVASGTYIMLINSIHGVSAHTLVLTR